MYCFPGGGVHAGESEAEALTREIREELGVPIQPGRPLWKSVTPWKVPLTWWLAELATNQPLRANPQEVESVHWLTPADLMRMNDLLASNREFLVAWQKGEFELPHCGR
jgi:8-oxo-dGTP pyrophosphatase MutT (NUDIX family)